MLKAAQAYFQTQVQTTSQGQLLLMLYDGAIKFLKQAKVKINEKNYAEKGILISKAIDVISELDSSLNPEKGGELAQNLHNLYFFCNTRLLQANLKMDTQLIDDVVEILSGLRDAYAQITDTPAADPANAQNTAPAPPPPGAKVMQMPQNQATDQQASSQQPAAQGQTAYGPRKAPQPAARQTTPPVQQEQQRATAAQGGQTQQKGTAQPPQAPQLQKAPQNGKTAPQQAPQNGKTAPQQQTFRNGTPAPQQGAQNGKTNQKDAPPAQTKGNGQQNPLPTVQTGPEAQNAEPGQQDNKRRLLAGSNIYRKMAQQQQS